MRAQGIELLASGSATTLLKTPRNVQVQTKSGGDYIYLGLANAINQFVCNKQNICDMDTRSIHISFNIDGLPLYKSSKLSFWPILCRGAFHNPCRALSLRRCR